MTFDALTVAAVAHELRQTILHGRVQHVVQSDERTIGLEIYAAHQRRWVLANADPQNARIHLTAQKPGAGERTSPLFLLLRKYVRGSRVVAVEQPPFERILILTLHRPAPDENHENESTVRLIIEAIGRYSNVILVDAGGNVLDALKRVTAELNRYRVTLPQRPYVPPPPPAKRRPDQPEEAELARLLTGADMQPAWQTLVAAYAGVSPLLAREVVFRATGRADTPARAADPGAIGGALASLWSLPATGDWEPTWGIERGEIVAFAPYRLTHLGEWRPAPGISAAVDAACERSSRLGAIDQARRTLVVAIDEQLALLQRKQESLERALAGHVQNGAMDRWRRYGDLILAQASSIRRGQTELAAEGERIPLDPSRGPADNAQSYFARYRKARAALTEVPALVEEAHLRIRYLTELRGLASLAESREAIRMLREELSGREVKPSRKRPRTPQTTGPTTYLVADGFEVMVGRSARENERVTFDLSAAGDLWLHARGVPGAHVILRSGGRSPSERAIREAGEIAAYYSAARADGRVAVDWTERRNVRRLGKGVPGLVSYRGERTVHVTPGRVTK
ncbi:MAG: NFACT family protein [Chloroflexi bacterium]|nr:NFACT family protein [Chloroflexota bacterium]